MTINIRYLIRAGLLAGVALLYVGAVGMITVFNEREVINDTLALGQVLIFAPAVIGGYVAARHLKTKEGANIVTAVLSGSILGVLTAVPTALVILLASTSLNVRDMFVSITPDYISILTFGQESFFAGILLLAVFLGVAGLVGAGIQSLPDRLRRALLTAVGWSLGVGLMSELLNQILGQFREYGWITRDTIQTVLQSGSLRLNFAIIIFVLAFVLSWVWPQIKTPMQRNMEQSSESTQRYVDYGRYALLFIILLALPWLVGRFLSDVMVTIGIYILMGLGLNIAVGLAGLLDLGYLTNFAVGAYVTGALISTGPLGFAAKSGTEIFNFWLIIPISLVAAMLTGFFFALPVLRMRGDYLAIATLGFGEIIGKLALSDWLRPFIGGAQGILFIPKPTFFGIELANPEQLYYIAFAACLLMLFVSIRLNNSRTGRQWMALREDEDVAAAMGIDTTRTKVIAFTLSAATGGLAGAIFASKVGTVFPNSFTIIVSINVLSLIIVGGMGSIPGIVVGAITLVGLPEILREFSEFRFLLYGALLVVMMLNRPEGLWPSEVRLRELHADDELLTPAPTD